MGNDWGEVLAAHLGLSVSGSTRWAAETFGGENGAGECSFGLFAMISSEMLGGFVKLEVRKTYQNYRFQYQNGLIWDLGVAPILGNLIFESESQKPAANAARVFFPEWWVHFARFYWKARTTSHVLGSARHAAWCQEDGPVEPWLFAFLPIQALIWICSLYLLISLVAYFTNAKNEGLF